MARIGHSDPNIWGGYNHYDEQGHKTGHSVPNFWGGYNEYDDKGHKVGHSEPSIWGGFNHYDEQGHKTGHSDISFYGYNHYDNKGNKTGSSDPSIFGYSHNDAEGCYIATCVYGSYDCPEVWVLRRYRDFVLKKSFPGRIFVKAYYTISPKLVCMFGERTWFKCIWKKYLDRRISRLKDKGYKDTAYYDRKAGV